MSTGPKPVIMFLVCISTCIGITHSLTGHHVSLSSCSSSSAIIDIVHPDHGAIGSDIFVYDHNENTEFSYNELSSEPQLRLYQDRFKDRTSLEPVSPGYFRVVLKQLQPGDSGHYTLEMTTRGNFPKYEMSLELQVTAAGYHVVAGDTYIHSSTSQDDGNKTTPVQFITSSALLVITIPAGLPANTTVIIFHDNDHEKTVCEMMEVCTVAFPQDIDAEVVQLTISQDTECGTKEGTLQLEVTYTNSEQDEDEIALVGWFLFGAVVFLVVGVVLVLAILIRKDVLIISCHQRNLDVENRPAAEEGKDIMNKCDEESEIFVLASEEQQPASYKEKDREGGENLNKPTSSTMTTDSERAKLLDYSKGMNETEGKPNDSKLSSKIPSQVEQLKGNLKNPTAAEEESDKVNNTCRKPITASAPNKEKPATSNVSQRRILFDPNRMNDTEGEPNVSQPFPNAQPRNVEDVSPFQDEQQKKNLQVQMQLKIPKGKIKRSPEPHDLKEEEGSEEQQTQLETKTGMYLETVIDLGGKQVTEGKERDNLLPKCQGSSVDNEDRKANDESNGTEEQQEEGNQETDQREGGDNSMGMTRKDTETQYGSNNVAATDDDLMTSLLSNATENKHEGPHGSDNAAATEDTGGNDSMAPLLSNATENKHEEPCNVAQLVSQFSGK